MSQQDQSLQYLAGLEQENNKLRQEVAALRRELYPPEPPKKELKYWIVTWLVHGNTTVLFEATACASWRQVVDKREELKQMPFISHISILEQRVLL